MAVELGRRDSKISKIRAGLRMALVVVIESGLNDDCLEYGSARPRNTQLR